MLTTKLPKHEGDPGSTAEKQEREEINVLMKERATQGTTYELYIFSNKCRSQSDTAQEAIRRKMKIHGFEVSKSKPKASKL